MTFDSPIQHSRSSNGDVQPVDNFEINPHGPRGNNSQAPAERTPLTEAEQTLRSALQATMANGGVPNEHAVDLFRDAMTQAETAVKNTVKVLKDNEPITNQYLDSDRKILDIVRQLDPDKRKDLTSDTTAYLQGLVPRDKMEAAMAKTFSDYPDLVPALKERYDADHSPSGPHIRALLDTRPRLLEDRLMTAKMYSAALDAEASGRPLGDTGIGKRLGD